MACASAWTIGGWPSPAITRLDPRRAWRSLAMAATLTCAGAAGRVPGHADAHRARHRDRHAAAPRSGERRTGDRRAIRSGRACSRSRRAGSSGRCRPAAAATRTRAHSAASPDRRPGNRSRASRSRRPDRSGTASRRTRRRRAWRRRGCWPGWRGPIDATSPTENASADPRSVRRASVS